MSIPPKKPAPTNNLKALRNARGWTQQEMAEKMGMSRGGYVKLEDDDRNLKIERVRTAANIFGVSMDEIIAQDAVPTKIPVMGYVSAGGSIDPRSTQVPKEGLFQIELPLSYSGDYWAFERKGNNLRPSATACEQDSALIIVWRKPKRSFADLIGQEVICLTSDKRFHYCRMMAAQTRGTFNLESLDGTSVTIANAIVKWASEICFIVPPNRDFRTAVADRRGKAKKS